MMESGMDKYEVVKSIQEDYFKYNREWAYDYIESGYFTKDELVDKFGLLTARAYDHILKYPCIRNEQEYMPICPMNPENNIIKGNIDVLFFGVCGSGGKTCLMASLMSLVGESADFLYQEFYNNKECDNAYGQYLADYPKSNRLPCATAMSYIQVVNTLIKINSKYKGVNFIEFPGEHVHELAVNSREEGMSGGDIPHSLIKILNNQNKKIIFLTIDPTHNKPIPLGDIDHYATPSVALSCVISHFKNNRAFMRNVIGFHTIISKSDRWLKGSLSSSIEQAVKLSDASGLLLQIQELCDTYNVNKHLGGNVGPIPFSIGRFMMGDTYEFDNGDAKKLLQLIKQDIEAYESRRSVLSRLASYFNN